MCADTAIQHINQHDFSSFLAPSLPHHPYYPPLVGVAFRDRKNSPGTSALAVGAWTRVPDGFVRHGCGLTMSFEVRRGIVVGAGCLVVRRDFLVVVMPIWTSVWEALRS